jgi:hypothetical protein
MKNMRNFSTVIRALLAMCLSVCTLSALAQDKDSNAGKKNDYGTLSLGVDSARKASDLPAASDPDQNNGETWGGFVTKQTAEFGGRISDFTGNQGTWDTFVNMGTGPRLLEYTLNMQSPNHTGLLFDNFSFSNFGYGGDPNNVSRLNFSKGSAYTFNATFRRDQNIFDYNLLANPLNPSTSVPNVPVLDSPHEFLLTRRMSDVNLNLFPVGKVRFKLGWSRVVNEGTSFTSIHQGTDGLVNQPTLNTTDNYTFGVSFRFIPKTSINFDQFYTYFKGDTSGTLAGTPFRLAGNIPVSLGLAVNSAAGQPCSAPLLGTGFVNPACNGLFSYTRSNNTRNAYPTEQLSFQSNYFKRVDLSGRFGYMDADSDVPNFNETFSGLITRNRVRGYTDTGFSSAKRISMNGDFGTTVHLTDRLRLVDNFRYDNFRIPTAWNYATANVFGATLLSNPNVFSTATCPPPFTAATCPQHNASSAADLVADSFTQYVSQESKINTVELEYDVTRRVGVHAGYRFERRDLISQGAQVQIQTFFPGPTAALANRGLCAAPNGVVAGGICTVEVVRQAAGLTAVPAGTAVPILGDNLEINGHSALFGVSARPNDRLRVSLDTEFFYADNFFTRITPRHMQRYKGRVSYKVTNWWNFASAINIKENRNTTSDIGNLQHNRSYAVSSTFAPAQANWGLDVAYDYNDIFSQTNICFVSTPALPGALSCGTPFLAAPSVYNETSHVGSGSFYFKPLRRVMAGVGYTVTSSNGNTLILNPIAPTGPLASNYHLPSGSLAVELTKNLTYKTGWNYYDYNEKSNPGPTLPRDFRGNTFTMSLRYTM